MDYRREETPDTTLLVDSARRTFESQIRSLIAKRSRLLAQFGSPTFQQTTDGPQMEPSSQEDTAHEKIEHFNMELDTLKMIAYRAETVMANVLAPLLARPDEARSLLRTIFSTDAGLLPGVQSATLTLRLHHSPSGASDRVVRKGCQELISTETVFPRSDLPLTL